MNRFVKQDVYSSKHETMCKTSKCIVTFYKYLINFVFISVKWLQMRRHKTRSFCVTWRSESNNVLLVKVTTISNNSFYSFTPYFKIVSVRYHFLMYILSRLLNLMSFQVNDRKTRYYVRFNRKTSAHP